MSGTIRAAVAVFATAAATTATAALPATAGALTLSVTTNNPSTVAATSATLRARVSVSAFGAAVTWQYGPSADYGTTSGPVGTALVGVEQTLTTSVTGLTPATTYHVRAIAVSAFSTAYGRDLTFTTAPATRGNSGDGTGSSGPGSGNSGSGNSGSGPGASGSDGSGPSPSATGDPAPAATEPSPGPAPASPAAPAAGKPDDNPSSGDLAQRGNADAGITPGVATATATPVLGRSLAAATVQGTVTATSPAGTPVDLSAVKVVPTGTVIDARAGTVELKTALDHRGATQTAHFWGSIFEVRQAAGARGLTRLVLRGGDFSGCAAGAPAHGAVAQAAAKKKPPRSLWGSDNHGRFETRGRGSVATVRGTRWLTQDTCAGTVTRVLTGAVAVHDLRRDRTVLVTHGHRYLARLPR